MANSNSICHYRLLKEIYANLWMYPIKYQVYDTWDCLWVPFPFNFGDLPIRIIDAMIQCVWSQWWKVDNWMVASVIDSNCPFGIKIALSTNFELRHSTSFGDTCNVKRLCVRDCSYCNSNILLCFKWFVFWFYSILVATLYNCVPYMNS